MTYLDYASYICYVQSQSQPNYYKMRKLLLISSIIHFQQILVTLPEEQMLERRKSAENSKSKIINCEFL